MTAPDLSAKRSGFSLVEVALAIAIVSFAVIGIISLMSSGLGNYRQVMDTTIAAQIAQRIINDAEQADYKVLTDATAVSGSPIATEMAAQGKVFSFRWPTLDAKPEETFRYFDEQGKEIIAEGGEALEGVQKLNAVYWVNMRIAPKAKLPRIDGKATELAQITVEVACNPNGVNLAEEYIVTSSSSSRYNLLDLEKLPGMRVLTYSAYIGRSE